LWRILFLKIGFGNAGRASRARPAAGAGFQFQAVFLGGASFRQPAAVPGASPIPGTGWGPGQTGRPVDHRDLGMSVCQNPWAIRLCGWDTSDSKGRLAPTRPGAAASHFRRHEGHPGQSGGLCVRVQKQNSPGFSAPAAGVTGGPGRRSRL